MTIGQTIAAERRKLGLSQEQLGEKMGVTRQSISKWESDAALPELEKLIALSRLFRMPEIEVTMEADSWIGVVFIATDNLGRTSTNGEFFTIQDDMLIFTDDTDPIWEAIRSAQDSE